MSSSDSSSDSESEMEEQTPVKAAIQQDDSSSDSSSDEEEETAKPIAKKEDSSSSDDDSDSDEEEEEKVKQPPKQADAESDDSDSSSDEEEEAEKPAPSKAKESDSDSDSSSDEEEEKPAKAKADDSSDDSSDDEAEKEEAKPKATPAESSDSSDSDGEDEEEKPKEAEKEKPKETEAKTEASKEVEFIPTKSKNPVTILFEWQIGKEDALPRKRKLSTPSLPVAKKPSSEKTKPAAVSATPASSVSVTIEKEFNPDDFRSADLKDQTNTIFVKGIDVNAFEADIEAFFTEKVAKPVSIRHKWEESRPGLAWITFATNEQASKAVIDCNGEYIKDRYVFTDWAKPKQNSGGGKRSSGPRNAHLKDTTNRVWVGNLHREVDRDSLFEFFKATAEATDVYILAGDGSRPQIAFVSFESNEVASKIVEEFQNSELLGNYLRLDWAEPRRDGGSGGRGTKRKQELSEKPDGCVTCFVGRLSDNVDDDKLIELFKDAGEIERIRYMERDGEFKGVAFVQFTETDSTDKAVQLNGTSFLGKSIRVDYAADRKKREY